MAVFSAKGMLTADSFYDLNVTFKKNYNDLSYADIEKEFKSNIAKFNKINSKKVVKIDEYTLKTNLSIKKIENSFLDPESLSVWKIPGFIELLKESGFSPTKHQMYFFKTTKEEILLRNRGGGGFQKSSKNVLRNMWMIPNRRNFFCEEEKMSCSST